jgi:hypothetical protein
MCRFKSVIILREKIYCPPNYDHHSQILEELGIKDDSNFPNFVRVEMIPKDNDIFNHNLDNWKLNVDQDFRPDWFDEEKAEKEMKIKMREVFEKCFAINQEKRKEYKDVKLWIKNSKVNAYGNSTVEAYDNSTVEAYGNSTVEAYDNSTVEAYDNSTVKACGNSTIKAYDNSTVEACGNSTILIS